MSTVEKLLELLKNNRETSLSGQKIGDAIGISRSAVWKAVEQLRNEGFEIESRPHVGYRLLSVPDLLSESEIGRYISSPCDLSVYDTVDSTLRIAAEYPLGSKPLYIAADCQTAGRGRLGRSFASPSGSGLYLTLAFRPEFEINKALYVTMAAAVAAAKAIEKVCGISPEIKWVNDLFYKGRKICGILTEAKTSLEVGHIDSLLIGIGINCFPGGLPEELSNIAGSISDVPGSFSRNKLAAEVFNQLTEIIKNLESKEFMDDYRSRCFILGKNISVHPHLNGDAVRAHAIDIDENGGLVVTYLEGDKAGQTDTLTTGEVSVRPDEN